MSRHSLQDSTAARLLTLCLLGALSCGLVGHTLLDHDGWERRQRLQGDLANLSLKNKNLQHEVNSLGSEVEALGGHGEAQEHAVRDELGWVRGRHELVIHFDEP